MVIAVIWVRRGPEHVKLENQLREVLQTEDFPQQLGVLKFRCTGKRYKPDNNAFSYHAVVLSALLFLDEHARQVSEIMVGMLCWVEDSEHKYLNGQQIED